MSAVVRNRRYLRPVLFTGCRFCIVLTGSLQARSGVHRVFRGTLPLPLIYAAATAAAAAAAAAAAEAAATDVFAN